MILTYAQRTGSSPPTRSRSLTIPTFARSSLRIRSRSARNAPINLSYCRCRLCLPQQSKSSPKADPSPPCLKPAPRLKGTANEAYPLAKEQGGIFYAMNNHGKPWQNISDALNTRRKGAAFPWINSSTMSLLPYRIK